MVYEFKGRQEMYWALVVVAVTTLAQLVNVADWHVVATDPRTWIISAVAAVARAVLGRFLAI